MDLAREADDGAEALRGAGGRGDRVEQVGRPVGAQGGGGADRAGDHHGRGPAEQRVAEDRDLLDRVGAAGDHHTAAAAGLGLGLAGDGQHVVQRQLGAVDGPDRAGLHPQIGADPGHQGRRVELRSGAGAARRALHGRDRAAGGEDGDLAHGRRAYPVSIRAFTIPRSASGATAPPPPGALP